MSRLNFNVLAFPPVYEHSDGKVFGADTWPALFRRVAAHYGISVEAATALVENFLLRVRPELSRPSRTTTTSAGTLAGYAVTSRIGAWLQSLAHGPLRHGTVPDSEAASRLDICARCPHCVSLRFSCATLCAGIVASLRKKILQRSVKSAGGCAILGEDIAVSARLALPTATVGDLPGHCWRLK